MTSQQANSKRIMMMTSGQITTKILTVKSPMKCRKNFPKGSFGLAVMTLATTKGAKLDHTRLMLATGLS